MEKGKISPNPEMNYSSETLDRISRSGEAVFAVDSSDRVVLGTKDARSSLGNRRAACSGNVVTR